MNSVEVFLSERTWMDLGPALPTHIVQIYLVHFQRNYHWVIVEGNHPEYTSTMSHTHTQMMHVCYHIYIYTLYTIRAYIYIYHLTWTESNIQSNNMPDEYAIQYLLPRNINYIIASLYQCCLHMWERMALWTQHWQYWPEPLRLFRQWLMQQAQADSENRIPRDIEAVPVEKYMFPCVTFFFEYRWKLFARVWDQSSNTNPLATAKWPNPVQKLHDVQTPDPMDPRIHVGGRDNLKWRAFVAWAAANHHSQSWSQIVHWFFV